RTSWDEVVTARPEVLLIAPCGFALDRARSEVDRLARLPQWGAIPAVRSGFVSLADGSSFFARPGPRLEASLRIAAAAIDPEACGDLAPASGWERRSLAV